MRGIKREGDDDPGRGVAQPDRQGDQDCIRAIEAGDPVLRAFAEQAGGRFHADQGVVLAGLHQPVQDDIRAFVGQRFGDGLPDPARRPGNECRFPAMQHVCSNVLE